MLTECRIKLFSQTFLKKEDLTPERIHGLFFSMLPEKAAEELHKLSLKPFTLYSPFFFSNREETKSFHIRITFLNERLFVAFTENIIVRKPRLMLGEKKLHFAGFSVINSISYQNLIQNDALTSDFLFQFKTPTTFKKGNFDFPLPDPELIFKSLLNKWNAFSPIKIEFNLKKLKYKIALHGAWIRTEKVDLSKDKRVLGFRGRVLLYTSAEKEELKLLNTLYRFAPFSGVGRKTTMGLGYVKTQQALNKGNL